MKIEQQQIDVLSKIIKRFNIQIRSIAEAGARDCGETLELIKLFPSSKIKTFEPDPRNIPICKNNITGINNIELVEKAVSDTSGKIKYNLYPKDGGSSSIYSHKETNMETIEVEVTTLSAEFNGKQKPDLLWLDAQGAELSILVGAGEILDDISLIQAEVYFVGAYKNQPLYRDVKKYLNKRGFTLFTFSSRGKNFGDAVFINKKIYKRKTPQWFTELFYLVIERIMGWTRHLKNLSY